MSLLIRINELVKKNSQFIIATHSPILLACPNAQILEITESGIIEKSYQDTEHFRVMENFFKDPKATVSRLLETNSDL